MKVAACLFVRNEVSDIASWLAWYHVLGFDSCIVYDDNSTDGTWEVLLAVAQVQDVRALRTVPDGNNFHHPRQNACYLDAIRRHAQEFEWIGFFDADEYLYLRENPSIKKFLYRFPSAGSIGVNWCHYGSSGHVLKPTVSPIEAYTWHSEEAFPINQHVKTLLRLSAWQGGYINMHCFDVAPETALNPAGEAIHWSETMGIIEGLPDWSVAKVMHYQCRSMEHFLERLRRVPSLPRNTALWAACDVNSVEDRSPLTLAPALNAHIAGYRVGANYTKEFPQPRLAGSVSASADWQHREPSDVSKLLIERPASWRPVVHVDRLGNLGNHMIQYMTALKLASRLENCSIAGIDLTEWGIKFPSLPDLEQDRSIVIKEEGRIENNTHGLIDFDGIAALIREEKYDDVRLMTYCQNIGNFLPRDFYDDIFTSGAEHFDGYGEDILLCNIRGGDILDGHHKDYVLVPIEYYQNLVETTGLSPVFFGQISENCYLNELRQAFPTARFVSGTSPIVDFEIIRRSRNIAVCVSTFSWLASWLSKADRIFMPLTGLFNPFQHTRSLLAPARDNRYTFHLFPANYAVPVADFRSAHDPLQGRWRSIEAAELEELLLNAPRNARNKDRAIAVFDESYYLSRFLDIQQVVASGRIKSGLEHFISNGFSEHRDPLLVDVGWYTRTYPQAAQELGQGDYEDAIHHYAEVGVLRGYLPCKPIESALADPKCLSTSVQGLAKAIEP